jgi:hypothetical protein
MPTALRLTRFAWMIVLPALAGCGRGENVTVESIARAKQTWTQAGIRDYDLDWTSAGRNNAYYHVTVRGGVVRSIEQILTDGRSIEMHPAQPKYFGVDGLFLTIAEELAQLKTERPFGQAKGSKAVLRFSVDPKYGYPRSYRRDVVGSFLPVAIDVVRFNPDPDPGAEPKRAGSAP